MENLKIWRNTNIIKYLSSKVLTRNCFIVFLNIWVKATNKKSTREFHIKISADILVLHSTRAQRSASGVLLQRNDSTVQATNLLCSAKVKNYWTTYFVQAFGRFSFIMRCVLFIQLCIVYSLARAIIKFKVWTKILTKLVIMNYYTKVLMSSSI